jgi:hypothetical protein
MHISLNMKQVDTNFFHDNIKTMQKIITEKLPAEFQYPISQIQICGA